MNPEPSCPGVVRAFIQPIDALLLLMVLIWGSNFSIVKAAFEELPPHGFNAIRLAIASVIFLAILSAQRGRAPVAAGDWRRFVLLAVVGHLMYQVGFIAGLSRTSVANSSLIMGCSPIAVALLSAARGHDRVAAPHWIGAGLSLIGVFLVVGADAAVTRTTLTGDVLMCAAVLCWAVYTVEARPLLARHSPLVVTGYTMAIGALLYLPVGLPSLWPLDWAAVNPGAWVSLVFSAVFALGVAYLIWYTAVQRIGNARTSIYSNMVPVAAMAVAAVWLGEPVPPVKIAGAAAILLGLGCTRLGRGPRVGLPR